MATPEGPPSRCTGRRARPTEQQRRPGASRAAGSTQSTGSRQGGRLVPGGLRCPPFKALSPVSRETLGSQTKQQDQSHQPQGQVTIACSVRETAMPAAEARPRPSARGRRGRLLLVWRALQTPRLASPGSSAPAAGTRGCAGTARCHTTFNSVLTTRQGQAGKAWPHFTRWEPGRSAHSTAVTLGRPRPLAVVRPGPPDRAGT